MTNHVPQPYSISADERYIRQRKVDNVSSAVVYIGEHMSASATDTSGGWRIKRISIDGSVVTEQVAKDGQFTCVWANRTSYFPPPPTPGFTNTKSLLFDGTNDVLITTALNHFRYERTDTFSFSCWINLVSVTGIQYIVTNKTSTATSRGWGIQSNAGVITVYLTSSTGNGITLSRTSAISANTWYHLVVTYDGSSNAAGVQVYLNGLVQPVNITLNALTGTMLSTNNVVIGGAANNTNYFNGHMDEISFYNTVLTPAQVTTLYNSGHPGDLATIPFYSNLVAWYRCGDVDIHPGVFDQKGTFDLVMTNMIPGNFTTVVP